MVEFMAAMTTAEFTIPLPYKTDRRSPVRWVISHLLHQWAGLLIAITGEIGNAALAGVSPVLLGQAFNQISKGTVTAQALIRIALILAGSRSLRGLQIGRAH